MPLAQARTQLFPFSTRVFLSVRLSMPAKTGRNKTPSPDVAGEGVQKLQMKNSDIGL
ncbi:hypothetical protein RLEG12_25260 [Rhizobium leguminosarum bv. trifolii CB782]|nr:hypothetical protein RLEG12_25260 [Rhizobium leguminosarum bv. trifolii CB782]